MAALLTSVTGSTDDVVKYINECREMGIAVEAPDINLSDANFTPRGSAIRFGLAAVKNVGRNAIDSIVTGRKELGNYASIYQFCEKIDLRLLNKRVARIQLHQKQEPWIPLRPPRPVVMAVVLDKAIGNTPRSSSAMRNPASTACSEFFRRRNPPRPKSFPTLPTGMNTSGSRRKKRFSGFFITAAILLEKYRDKLDGLHALSTADLAAMKNSTGKDENLTTAGIITGLKVQKSKKGDFYAQAALEDLLGSVEMIVFPEAYRRLQEKVKLEVPVLVRGGLRVEEGANPKLTVSDIQVLEDVKVPLPRSLRIRSPLQTATESTVDALQLLCLEEERGSQSVV